MVGFKPNGIFPVMQMQDGGDIVGVIGKCGEVSDKIGGDFEEELYQLLIGWGWRRKNWLQIWMIEQKRSDYRGSNVK